MYFELRTASQFLKNYLVALGITALLCLLCLLLGEPDAEKPGRKKKTVKLYVLIKLHILICSWKKTKL